MKSKRLGKAILLARTELGDTQAEFGARFGVGHGSVGVWEKTGEIPEHRWPLLKELCGIDPAEYADDENKVIVATRGNKSVEIARGKSLSPAEESLILALRKLGENEDVEIYGLLGVLAEKLKAQESKENGRNDFTG